MTPLFAASLASQTGQTQTDFGGSVGSVAAAGGLRATQRTVEFTPTQGEETDTPSEVTAPQNGYLCFNLWCVDQSLPVVFPTKKYNIN